MFNNQSIIKVMSKSIRFALFGAVVMMLASCKNMQVKPEYFVIDKNPLVEEGGRVQ